MTLPRYTLDEARRAWLARQRLRGSGDAPNALEGEALAAAVAALGWLPLATPGAAYVSLYARGLLAKRASLDALVQREGALAVAPGPRGLLHLVPSAEAPLCRAFAVADHASREAKVAAAEGLTARSLEGARDALRAALASPRSSSELRARLPSEALAPLGELARKAGAPTLAALALRGLWAAGEVTRGNDDERLDGARVRWSLEPLRRVPIAAADAVPLAAPRWLAAHGPARLRVFAAAFGLAAGRAAAALKGAGVVELAVDGDDEPWITLGPPPAAPPSSAPACALLPARDALTEAHGALLADAAAQRALAGRGPGFGASVLYGEALVASWVFDPVARLVSWRAATASALDDGARATLDREAARCAAFLAAEVGRLPLHEPAAPRARGAGALRTEPALDVV